MTKIKTVIVDDEALARTRIRRLLEDDKEIKIVGESKNGLEAVEALNGLKPDMVFLDVQMPELNGFEVLEEFDPDDLPVIVFVTAYDQYALKAFEVHAVDYLLKPFEDERFYDSLQHAKEQIKNLETNSFTSKIMNLLSDKSKQQEKHIERIVVKSSGRIYFVKTKDIVRIKAAGKYLEVLSKEKEHVIRQTMTDIESKLDPSLFLRIHRSTIINIDHIKEIQHWYKNEYIFKLKNGEEFTSGGSYRKNLDRVLK